MTNIDLTKFKNLSSAARDVMRQLFFKGPTWDGDITSKAGRGELCELELVQHAHGFAWLTDEGVRVALDFGLDRAKEKWERERRRSA